MMVNHVNTSSVSAGRNQSPRTAECGRNPAAFADMVNARGAMDQASGIVDEIKQDSSRHARESMTDAAGAVGVGLVLGFAGAFDNLVAFGEYLGDKLYDFMHPEEKQAEKDDGEGKKTSDDDDKKAKNNGTNGTSESKDTDTAESIIHGQNLPIVESESNITNDLNRPVR